MTYGNWLIAVFDRWYSARRVETRVRLFESVISLLLGGQGTSEPVGLSPVCAVVIETDGDIEQIDSLKTTILESQANSNILTELATRSSGEAAGILQTRLLASLDEWKAALGQVVLPSTVPSTAPSPAK